MCMCERPTVNGEPGYSWDGREITVLAPNPPELMDCDELIFDGPGRCGGGIDSHCHHIRLVRQCGRYFIIVRNGSADDKRINLGGSFRAFIDTGAFEGMDSNDRYWLLLTIYNSHRDGQQEGRYEEHVRWVDAAASGRIKTRKRRSGGTTSVSVWIDE